MAHISYATARHAVYALGVIVGGLIAAAATWVITLDHERALDNAELHLDNFTVALAEHTQLALRTAGPDVLALATGSAFSGTGKEAVQRYFAERYEGLELAYTGRISLLREDGTLLSTLPRRDELLGRSFSEHPLFALVRAGQNNGSVDGPSIVEQDRRLVAYRRVKGYPLIVAVSTPMAGVLAPWRRNANVIALGAILFGTLAGAAATFIGRQLRQTEHLTRDAAANEVRLTSIIGSAMDAIITVDAAQHIVLFNAAAEKIFRCSAVEAIGTPLERFIPSRYRSQHAAHVERFGEAGLTMRRMGGALVLAGLRSDGDEFPIDASISHVTVGGEKFYTVILRDITERQHAADSLVRSHEELRELYESMHEVREAERTRIARELHDELAQWLTALKMDVSWIRTRLPGSELQLINKADRMKGVVDSTIAAMRRIASDLRPVMLDDLGLMAAIENLLHELSERTGIQVSLTGSDAMEALREPLVTGVYRMIQEALTNVARHSAATHVGVALDMANERLAVTVRDNGRGLNPDPDHKSFGLLGIRERARTLGGEARIHSPAEGGTIVEISVPLARYLKAEASA